ncbi:hypothetical protein, partial [Streptomyces alkaliterrae]
MAVRPSAIWHHQVAEQARAVALGRLTHANASLAHRYPDDLISRTDTALAAFEAEIAGLPRPAPPVAVLTAVRHVLGALDFLAPRLTDTTCETVERAQLRAYVRQVIAEHDATPAPA